MAKQLDVVSYRLPRRKLEGRVLGTGFCSRSTPYSVGDTATLLGRNQQHWNPQESPHTMRSKGSYASTPGLLGCFNGQAAEKVSFCKS